jgi:hypothetical protein
LVESIGGIDRTPPALDIHSVHMHGHVGAILLLPQILLLLMLLQIMLLLPQIMLQNTTDNLGTSSLSHLNV